MRELQDQMEGDSCDTSATPSNRRCTWITGSARKIRDNAADWHNLMLSSQGDLLVLDTCPPPSQSTSAEAQQVAGAAELQDECLKLQDVVDRMVVVVKKMEHLVEIQRGVLQLEEFQFGPEGRRVPLCLSWKTREFEEMSGVLLAAFSQELKLKQTILQEVAHTMTSDLSKVYLSCWLHQPFIPAATRLGLEALLLETGHRPL
ncbi:cyclin-dependent kinase 2-interacting protein isoform X2 [Nothobranchius furzeri]|uniref:Cyclin-dependent kinase 2 interacting protein n=1 Tax=Nothobranchius furzeri TaxID=105023 RepID=A0A1A7ZH07_NOTFU|nr:cyclin-dependent kinase 2-interacting protein isoform X2 [Nothobranchius furzeri]KAF7201108.1 transcript variant X2 [Nothobranchius furzeri]